MTWLTIYQFQVTELDPSYAKAWERLATANVMRCSPHMSNHPDIYKGIAEHSMDARRNYRRPSF